MITMTIFSDASLCPKTGAAGWGAWAKRSDWQFGRTMGGELPARMATSLDAETCALANALHFLLRDDALRDVEHLMLQSDCIRALQLVRLWVPRVVTSDHKDGAPILIMRKAKLSAVEKEARAHIIRMAGQLPARIAIRHVRGHKRGDGRQWVNRECDAIAGRYMNAVRQRLAVIVHRERA